jgi:hypothetical protein
VTDKPKRGQGPLTPTQAADRIATALGELPDRIARGRKEAEATERAALQAHIGKLLARVPDGDRDKVARVLLALGCELNGFELQPANETAPAEQPPADLGTDGDKSWLTEDPEPAAPAVERDTETGSVRRVGKART